MNPKAIVALAAGLIAWGTAADATTQQSLSSGGTLTTAPNDEVVTDRDSLDEISYQSQGIVDPTLEAFWVRGEQSAYFNHEPIGYVKMDDWDELDIDELWQSYVDGAKAQSEQFGFEVRPLRWVIQPTLDRQEAVAYYALEVQFADEPPLVNMVILDFGRYGYEEMTVVQNSDDFPLDIARDVATSIAGAYDFGPQAGYFDFQEGDRVAAVGAAGLVAAAFGTKFGKGFLATALLLLKKFWFVLLAIPAILWKWFSRGSAREA